MGLPINFNPSEPVANTPFYSPRTNSLSTPQGANLVIGSGLDVTPAGVLTAPGSVAVTLVDTGVGLTGGPITTTGTISLADTAVSAGSYTYGSFTVDAQGRLTAAASGTAAVTAVTGTAPIDVTAGLTPVVSIAAATTAAQGAVQVGTNINVTSGTISVPAATTAAQGAVQVGTNISVTAGTISVANSSTSGKGVVQLNNSTNNSSTDLALTAAQGKSLQEQIDALAVAVNITLAGSYDASTGLMTTVTTAGIAAGFLAGNVPPDPDVTNNEFFIIVDVQGSTAPAVSVGGTPPYHIGDWWLSDGVVWTFLNLGYQATAATTAVEGVVYLATDLEVQTGTDTSNKAVNPASLQAKVSDSTSTTDSFAIASSTAVKSAYDLADAAIPNSTFNAKGDIIVGTGNDTYGNLTVGTNGQILVADSTETFGVKWAANAPDGVQGITGTAPITVNNTDPANPIIGIDAASTTAAGAVQLNDTTSSTSTTEAATANAVKSAYDLANDALPLAGGTMTGNIEFLGGDGGVGLGVIFNDSSNIRAISDDTGTTSSTTAASSTAVKAAYDLANGALPKSGGTMTGAITFVAGQTFPGATVSDATVSSKGIVQIGTNIQVASGVISVLNSSTSQSGVVQLNDTVASTSVTEALTAKQGKALQDQITALTAASNLTLAGTFDASASQILTVTAAGTAKSFVVGSNLPSAAVGNTDYFVIVTTGGSYNPPGGGGPYTVSQGDWLLSTGTAWQFLNVGAESVAAATPTAAGAVLGCTNATNAALGCGALRSNTTGTGNVAIGLNAGCSNLVGVNNVAIGNSAGLANLGSGSVAVGTSALINTTTGGRNTAVGEQAAQTNVIGEYNAAFGWAALQNATGGCNTALGGAAGQGITTGGYNLAIGANVQVASATASCQLAIGWENNNWLTGNSTKAIKPGAGIIDCAASCGTVNQVLISNGANAIKWQTGAVGDWIDAGTMTIGATTTPPTLGTVSTNSIFYRQIGPKEYEVVYKYVQSAGGAVGSGDYLFTLPAGLTFNTTLPFQNSYTGIPGATPGWLQLMIPGPTQGHVMKDTTSASVLQPVVYNSTRFRLIGLYQASTSPAGTAVTNTWNSLGSGFFELGGNWNFVSRFAFTSA